VLAGGMNTARAARDIHSSFNAPQVWLQTMLAPTSTPRLLIPPIAVLEELLLAQPDSPPTDTPAAAAAPPTAPADPTSAPNAAASRAIVFVDPNGGPPPNVNVDLEVRELLTTQFGVASTTTILSGQARLGGLGLGSGRTGWANVTALEWTRLSGWTVLILVAVFGLTTLLYYRRRPAPQRTARILSTLAWVAFSGYFVAHAVLFVRQW
jgi:hypothetical protein